MDRQFDDYVSAADEKERKAMKHMSKTLLYRMGCELRGIDPDLPIFSNQMVRFLDAKN
jgi:hypothetical protein